MHAAEAQITEMTCIATTTLVFASEMKKVIRKRALIVEHCSFHI